MCIDVFDNLSGTMIIGGSVCVCRTTFLILGAVVFLQERPKRSRQ